MPLEGHVPAYHSEDLAKVIYAGITTDHTQQTSSLVDEKKLEAVCLLKFN